MQRPDFNGPGRELRGGDHREESVYCTNCGTIFVPAGTERDCPSCTNAATLAALDDRLDELEARLDELETVVETCRTELQSAIQARPNTSRGGEE